MELDKISVVVPCYNEQSALPLFYEELCRVMAEMAPVEFEVIFVDDGSGDETVAILRDFCARDPRAHYSALSRNFGKEGAMLAGLSRTTGDFVVVMDADLQHPPRMMIDMYRGIREEGYDCVAMRRVSREGEPKIRSFFARAFYKIMNRISDIDIADGACDYRLMTRKMTDAVLAMKEYNRFSKGIFSYVGFRTKWLEYVTVQRVAGETKWSFWKLFSYSIEGIVAFSTVPLYLSSMFGVIFCILALLFGAVTIVKTLIFGEAVAGYPTMVCLILLLGGVQLLMIGILGQYMAKTYLETKRRPVFIVRESDED